MIRYLSSTGEYHILVFSKTTTCAAAKAVSSLPSVTLLLNRASVGYDLPTFVAAAQRCPSVLICSSPSNSEGKEGVQWGARLVQSAASAGAKHLVFLAMDRERQQYSTDSKHIHGPSLSSVRQRPLTPMIDFIHTQSKAPMAWTIIRSPANSMSSSPTDSERSLTAAQFRNLAYYVNWVFANPDRSTGLDFVLPVAEPSGVSSFSPSDATRRRDSRVEGPAGQSSQNQAAAARPSPSRTGSSGAQHMSAGQAKAVQQWVAKTSPESKEDRGESDQDEEEDDEDDESGSESE